MIKIEQFSFQYPNEKEAAIKDLSLEIQSGEFVVICGESGCGKSTLLRHLKPELAPFGEKSGDIYYYDRKMEALSHREQAEKIGFVLQNPEDQIVTDKVWHELAFGLESLGCSQEEIRLRVSEMASYFGIQDWFHKDVADLSGGQKQILNLASIMAMHPEVLILDEPTSQLDPIAAKNFLDTIYKINQEMGITMILTEHRLEEVLPLADQVVVMDHGKPLAMKPPGEIGPYLKEKEHAMFLAMPVATQIYGNLNQTENYPLTVKDGRKWIEGLCKKHTPVSWEHENVREEKIKESMIEVRDVWFRYDRQQPDILKGVSVQILKGEFFALLGGNGTGKSTLLSVIARVLTPYRGKIFLNGKRMHQYREKELYQEMLGVLPQDPKTLFVKKTVRQELEEMYDHGYSVEMEREVVISGMLGLMKLTELKNRHPYDLSGGEQQRLALAKILMLRPKILLMDEPTKGMDEAFKIEFANILKELQNQGVTILMISHDIEFCARYADRCGLFFDGVLTVCGNTRTFFAGNHFYTTAANRIGRNIWKSVITRKDLEQCLKQTIRNF